MNKRSFIKSLFGSVGVVAVTNVVPTIEVAEKPMSLVELQMKQDIAYLDSLVNDKNAELEIKEIKKFTLAMLNLSDSMYIEYVNKFLPKPRIFIDAIAENEELDKRTVSLIDKLTKAMNA